MVAAACLAILDSASARTALASFLTDRMQAKEHATAAMEFAIIGLGRKPLLPRETGLEHSHECLLRDLRSGNNKRLGVLAFWALESWRPGTSEQRRLAI